MPEGCRKEIDNLNDLIKNKSQRAPQLQTESWTFHTKFTNPYVPAKEFHDSGITVMEWLRQVVMSKSNIITSLGVVSHLKERFDFMNVLNAEAWKAWWEASKETDLEPESGAQE